MRFSVVIRARIEKGSTESKAMKMKATCAGGVSASWLVNYGEIRSEILMRWAR